MLCFSIFVFNIVRSQIINVKMSFYSESIPLVVPHQPTFRNPLTLTDMLGPGILGVRVIPFSKSSHQRVSDINSVFKSNDLILRPQFTSRFRRRAGKAVPLCVRNKCFTSMVKKLNSVGELRYNCPVCDSWRSACFCNGSMCNEEECVKNIDTGMLECPKCKVVGGKYAEPSADTPMSKTVIATLKRECINTQRCSNKECGLDTIEVNMREGNSSCVKCGLVSSMHLVDNTMLGERKFEEEIEKEFESHRNHDRFNANKDVQTFNQHIMLMSHEEIERQRDEKRFCEQLQKTWLYAGVREDDIVLQECVLLLVLYGRIASDKLKRSATTIPLQCAVIFIVTQNNERFRLMYSPLVLVEKFMASIVDKNNNTPSEKLRFSALSNQISAVYNMLGDKLPDQYKRKDGQRVMLYWLYVQELLRVRANSPLYPLEAHDIERLETNFMLLESDIDKRMAAQRHVVFSTAAVIYFQAMKTTSKTVKNKVVKMTIELTETIMCVCKATLSTVGEELFPTPKKQTIQK
jgi:hypothetical protein